MNQRVLGGCLCLIASLWVNSEAIAEELDLATRLQPFRSDGCSLFPDGTMIENELWLQCCLEHDIAYWVGGTFAEREAADDALRQCVASVGEPEVAVMMLMGVRVGGSPFLDTPFRWGYGWPYLENGSLRGYKPLSETEWQQVKKLRPKIVEKN